MGNKKQRQISLPLLVRRKPGSGELRRPSIGREVTVWGFFSYQRNFLSKRHRRT